MERLFYLACRLTYGDYLFIVEPQYPNVNCVNVHAIIWANIEQQEKMEAHHFILRKLTRRCKTIQRTERVYRTVIQTCCNVYKLSIYV